MKTKDQVKKAIYLCLWAMLGAGFAIVIAGLVEYISYKITNTLDVYVVLYASMMFVGIFAGLVVGPIAWRKIYIEGVRGKKYVIKQG